MSKKITLKKCKRPRWLLNWYLEMRQIVRSRKYKPTKPRRTRSKPQRIRQQLKDIVTYLADKAVARGSRDDISVLALMLGQRQLSFGEQEEDDAFMDCNNDDSSNDTYSSF